MQRIALSSLCLLAVATSNTCFGAAAVKLNNYDANAPVFFNQSGSLAGAGCYVQIYGGADFSSLVPLVSTAGGNGVFSLGDTPGFFDGGIGNVPGLPDNAPAAFAAHAWQGANTPGGWKMATYQDVAEWTQPTGMNTPPNLPTPGALNFPPGLVLVLPEPASWTLGLIGATALLLFRRKQR